MRTYRILHDNGALVLTNQADYARDAVQRFGAMDVSTPEDKDPELSIRQLRAKVIRRQRWYYAPVRLMRRWRALWAALLLSLALGQVPASAAPFPIVVTPTPCSGSWDGPGMTACELLGRPGQVGLADFDFSRYRLNEVPLYEITFYSQSNRWWIDQTGQFVYQRETNGPIFGSMLYPQQFGLWFQDERRRHVVIGVEDLTPDDRLHGFVGSDYDHNDMVLALDLEDDLVVPEPTSLALFGFAAIGVRLLVRRRASSGV
jgi:hypothetical protein